MCRTYRRLSLLLAAIALVLSAPSAHAGLTDTRVDTGLSGATVDGTISANEYGTSNAYSYTGAGTGFNGALGNGAVYLNSSTANLYLGLTLNNSLGSDLVTVYLDTKAGGFTDSTMFDNGDPGRLVITNLTASVNDNFPTGFLADYAFQFGNGFTSFFELNGGSLNYIAPTSAGTGGNAGAGDREASIPLSTLGVTAGGNIDFFATYISNTNFTSNESIPGQPFSGGGNPGFGSSDLNWDNFNRFTVVPEPASWILGLAGAGLFPLVRRRKK